MIPNIVFMTPLETLFEAIRQDDLKKVGILIDNDPAIVFGEETEYKATPLHEAALKGFKDAVELLLENKAIADAKDKDGLTPLHYAAAKGHTDVIKSLLAHGANVDIKAVDGRTVFQIANQSGNEDVAELLNSCLLLPSAPPPLTIKVFDDAGIRQYREKTSVLTLSSLRLDILNEQVSKDSKTVFITTAVNNKTSELEGTLIRLSGRYPLLAKVYRPIRYYARYGMWVGIIIGIAFHIEFVGFSICQQNQEQTFVYGVFVMALPLILGINAWMTYRKIKVPQLLQFVPTVLTFYLGFKLGLFFLGMLLGAAGSGFILWSMPGFTIGAIVGTIRLPNIQRARDAPREKTWVYIVIPFIISVALWAIFLLWVRPGLLTLVESSR
jgi:hypothetical protein